MSCGHVEEIRISLPLRYLGAMAIHQKNGSGFFIDPWTRRQMVLMKSVCHNLRTQES